MQQPALVGVAARNCVHVRRRRRRRCWKQGQQGRLLCTANMWLGQRKCCLAATPCASWHAAACHTGAACAQSRSTPPCTCAGTPASCKLFLRPEPESSAQLGLCMLPSLDRTSEHARESAAPPIWPLIIYLANYVLQHACPPTLKSGSISKGWCHCSGPGSAACVLAQLTQA